MPPRKKVKDSASGGVSAAGSAMNKPRRTVRGRLKDMLGMPTEVVMEIVSYLHPRDLVNLARTSKDWRAFLLNRRLEPIWRAARARVHGLPEIPSHLSEPAYANLVFFSYCHVCLKPNAHRVYWAFGTRICKGNYVCSQRICSADLVEDHVCYTLGDIAQAPFLSQDCSSVQKYFANDQQEVDEFWLKWDSLSDRSEQVKYIQERQAIVAEQCKFRDLMFAWEEREKKKRKQELSDLRAAR